MEQRKVTVRFAKRLLMGVDGLQEGERHVVINRQLVKLGVLTDTDIDEMFEQEKQGTATLVMIVDGNQVVRHWPENFEVEAVQGQADLAFLVGLSQNPPIP